MGEIEAYLLSFPQSTILLLLGGLMFVTCLGILPSNSDLTVLTAGMMSGFGHFSLWQVLAVCLIGYFLGEGFMYSIGYFIGRRVEGWGLYQKIMGSGSREKIFQRLQKKPLFFFISLRITPILRPFVILLLGATGVKPKIYLSYYLPVTFVYTIFLGTLSYVFSRTIRTHFADYKMYAIGVFFVAWGLLIRKLVKSQ